MSDQSPEPAQHPAPPRRSRLLTQPYVHGLGRFARRVPALLPVLLFLAIAWLDFGAELNVPAVFWGGGIGTGVSVTILFAYVWLVTYVLDATFDRHTLVSGPEDHGWLTRLAGRVFPSRVPNPDPAAVRLRAYMVVTFFPCLLLLALATLFRVSHQFPFLDWNTADPYAEESARPLVATRWHVLVGIFVGVAALRLLHAAGGRVFRRWSGLVGYSFVGRVTKSEERWVRAVVEGVFAAQAAAFLVFVLAVYYDWWYAPPVTAVCMFFGLVCGVCGFVWYHARRVALPAFAAVLLLVYVSNTGEYKLHFPGMEEYYASKVQLEKLEEPAGDWNAIRQDNRAVQWERVRDLVATRINELDDGQQPAVTPKADDLADRQKLTARFTALKEGPPSEENYRDMLRVYSTALDRARWEEQEALARWARVTPHAPASAPPYRAGKPKLVVVTVTGGANRSALWTAKVLHELHKLDGFPKHVRLVTGASGGMVGAAYYVGSVEENGELAAGFEPKDIAQEHIGPIMSSLVFREVPFLAIPAGHYTHDRGHALDLSFEGSSAESPEVRARLNRAFGRTVESLKAGERAGWRPPLVFTPMMVEDGRRLIIANQSLHYLTTSVGNIMLGDLPPRDDAADGQSAVAASQQRTKQLPPEEYELPPGPEGAVRPPKSDAAWRLRRGNPDVYGRSGVEFFHLFPAARKTFHVSTAARMNATFPYLSPAVDLPTVPPRRVVDAGFYDNYGVGMAAAWLTAWRGWLREHTSGVVVVQIRDSASQYDRRNLGRTAELNDRPNGRGGSSPVAWLTAPLAAVDNSRQSTASYRNDEMLGRLDEHFKSLVKDDPRFFQTVVFERFSNVGMSWYLNDEDKRQILASWDQPRFPGGIVNTNPGSLKLLEAWWKER